MRPSLIAILCSLPAATCVTPATEDVASAIGSGSLACSAPLAISLAPSPVSVALQTTAHLTAILTTTGATAGTATVSLTATDAITHAAVTGWTITAAQAVALPATGAVLVGFDVTVPGNSASMSVDLDAHVTLGTLVADAPGHVDVINRITIVIPAGAGTGSPHPGLGPQNLNVRAGTIVDIVNADTVQHVIHGTGGIPHETTTGGFPGTTYTVTINTSGSWYCHTHESSLAARTITVVP